MRPPPDLDENILHDFLRFHFVDEHSDQKGIDEPASAAIQRGETTLVAFSRHGQQPDVLARFRRKRIAG